MPAKISKRPYDSLHSTARRPERHILYGAGRRSNRAELITRSSSSSGAPLSRARRSLDPALSLRIRTVSRALEAVRIPRESAGFWLTAVSGRSVVARVVVVSDSGVGGVSSGYARLVYY
ncbi:hypothetical protein DFR70_1011250 [Nocardia tenerifensis]|uniref:Uncharacterized protein n=1 Tax=Nocardia tenerifensis TaxID=228006 RepID=A0A318KCG1_9NOCA|nr:hypothetical protein DFR70_1011250 [Nocardia tenerifensis]